MNRKIGILFGDFDPIYTEQINMCEDILNEFSLNRVFLIPFWMPRQRAEQFTTYIENRKDIIKLATWKNKNVSLLEDFEAKDSNLILQSEIIEQLEAKYNAESYYIITSNYFIKLAKNKNFETLVKNRNIIVAMRPHFTGDVTALSDHLSKKYNTRVYFSSTQNCVMSGTIIRAYIQMGLINNQHLPENVLEYMNKKILYRSNSGLFEKIREIEPAPIYNHTLASCINCIEIAQIMDINYNSALLLGLLHNMGKCYTIDSLRKNGIYVPRSCDRSAPMSLHGRLGEIAAQYYTDMRDEKILEAIKYHSTGRAAMPPYMLLLFTASALARYHNAENYEQTKYKFFENPAPVFFQMLEDKYKAACKTYAAADFPKDLRACYYYYRKKKNRQNLFRQKIKA